MPEQPVETVPPPLPTRTEALPRRSVDVVVDLRDTQSQPLRCTRCRSIYGLTAGQPMCINCNRDLWRMSRTDMDMDA